MKRQLSIITVFIIFFLTRCSLEKVKLIRKEVENDDINLLWYYYSYITNNSPDFIEVEKNGKKIQIIEAVGIIADCQIEGDTIRIKFFEPERGIIYPDSTPTDVFGYKIVLDSSATREEFFAAPKGKKKYRSQENLK